MLSIMNKELERLAFLKGFRIGLITAKSNFDVNNYINKLDYEINNLEHKDTKEEYKDTKEDYSNKTEIKQNNTTNLYTLLQHINNKINSYIKRKNTNSNNIILLNKTKFSHRTIQYIQAHNIKLNNDIDNLKKIYDILYNKYMKLLSKPVNEESIRDNSVMQNGVSPNSVMQNGVSPNGVSPKEEKVRNFIYNPTAFDNISASLNNTLSELTDTDTNTNTNTNMQNSNSDSHNPNPNESVVQQFNQSINNLTSLIMDDS